MRRLLTWGIRAFVAVLALLAVGVGLIYGLSERRMGARFAIDPAVPAYTADAATLARGEHLATIRGCKDCHGEDLGGNTFINDAMVARLSGANLTRGQGGTAAGRTDQDLVRAIRHAVARDGRPLLFMPSQEFTGLSDQDLGDLIAYVNSVPPVDRAPPENEIGPLGRLLFLAGQIPLLPAEFIDHQTKPATPAPGPTAEYGAYLATGCAGCHGAHFSGGRIPGTPPSWPEAANLTPDATGLAGWTLADFTRALREGVARDGRALDGNYMPVRFTKHLTDEEVQALYLFLQGLPATPRGNR